MSLPIALYLLSLLLALSIGLVLGLYLDWLRRRTMELQRLVQALWQRKADAPIEPAKPKASIIDPDDVAAQARRDFAENMNKLNPRR